MAILKHIASKNADYGKPLEYLMFEHNEEGSPVRDSEGNLRMREQFILDGINCTPFSFDKECEMVNAQYHKNRKFSDIKSHHYVISFDPEDCKDGRLSSEKAHSLGLEFAKKHFPGHQILVCTHPDGRNKSGNIHVHIIFNSVRKYDVKKEPYMDRNIDCRAGYKHHLTKNYLAYLQMEVVEMCKREGLHQVNLLSPAGSNISDKEFRAVQRDQRKLDALNERISAAGMKPRTTLFQTQKQYIRDAVSNAASHASSLDDFQKILSEQYRIDIKEQRGRFSYRHPDRQKYITGRLLGNDYEKEHVLDMILGTEYGLSYDYHRDPVAILYIRSSLRLVVDLQNNIKAQQSAAYARKVKLSNLKEMTRTIVYIQEHGYGTRDELQQTEKKISARIEAAEKALHSAEEKLRKTNEMIHFTGQYLSTKAVRSGFLNTRNKKSYRESHRDALDRYDEAVRFFKENTGGSVPSMKILKAEKTLLLDSVDKQKKSLAASRQEQKELRTAVSNVDSILNSSHIPKKTKNRSGPEL